MTPELRRAIIIIIPDYFSWNQKRQEQYRVETPDEDSFSIWKALFRELFHISVVSYSN